MSLLQTKFTEMKSNKILILFMIMAASVIIYSCKKDAEIIDVDDAPYVLDYGKFSAPPIPTDNPLTREGVKLGRMLFYEKALSQDNSMACASCHLQQFAFTDTATFSIGVKGLPGGRQAMTIFNMAWHSNEFFWDGRAHLLRDQSLKPIQDKLEMNETLPNVVAKLKAKEMYPVQFLRAFGTMNVTPELMSKAMEQFMNSIISNSSKYDDFLAGKATFTTQEERGRFLFFTEYNPSFPNASGADCQHCHAGDNFENDRYMNNGLDTDAQITDIGREKVTGKASDKAKFKVTSLRNIELSAPYMHDGRFKTLEEVINHYNKVKRSSTLALEFDQQLPQGLQLTQGDQKALVAFLKTLTDNQMINNPEYASPF